MKSAGNILKQIFSLILPVTVLILVPLSIESDFSVKTGWFLPAGLILVATGLYILVRTILLFSLVGKGTLAPWSPTIKLVTSGMYSYVRNPMITGVLIILTGESAVFLSINILIWAVVFFIINNIYFLLYEEPNLKLKFGQEYLQYKQNVNRWLPKIKFLKLMK